jgi:hypothetical protein
MDRMEDLMLGDKNTVPLWRQRRPQFLPLERALESRRTEDGAESMTASEQAIVGVKAEHRRAMTAKRRGKASGGRSA